MPPELVFATHNAHKRDEVRSALRSLGSDLALTDLAELGFADDPPETEGTFVGNALQKARYVHERLGRACLADDSGLEVDALGGAPGVHSKRFSPEQTAEANNRLLLQRLSGVVDRTARFRCVLAVVGPAGEWWVEGVCTGRIGHALRGAHGFGYDPLFYPDDAPGGERTLAELTMAEKDRISHRGRALRALVTRLAAVSR